MTPKDNNLYLLHIIEAILKIELYTADGEEGFLSDYKTQDAVYKNLEVIGEAANRLSKSFRDENTAVSWRDAIDCRNYIVHNYDGVDPVKIWETVSTYLPPFKIEICKLMPNWEDYKHHFKI